MTIINSTFSGNSADNNGGGIWSRGVTTIANSTITRNVSDGDQDGSGLGGGLFSERRVFLLDHSIVADNKNGSGTTDDTVGVVNSIYSLIDSGEEFLGPLADNGGPTFTHALLLGSPAINAGDRTLQQGNPDLPEFDQRGAPFARVANRRIDIGAYESQPTIGTFNGDFNDDGDVDGSDFLNWQRNVDSIAMPTKADGDATDNGRVDGNDLSVWEVTYGEELQTETLEESLEVIVEADDETTRLAQAVDLAMTKQLLGDPWKTSRLQQKAARRTVLTDFEDDARAPLKSHHEQSRPRPSLQPILVSVDVDPSEIPDKPFTLEQAFDAFFAQL